jgi:predicted amidophosphoribosyltransferase
MTITPADNPCNCRACGALILNEVSSMCEDCEADMNGYYDEREDAERDRQMTEDNYIRENYETPIGELYGGD